MITLRRSTHLPSQDRSSTLSNALREMRDLAARIPILSYTTRGRAVPPSDYVVEMRIRSPAAVSRQGAPEFADVFRLDVSLPQNYPLAPPVCVVSSDSATPFHPHFTSRRLFRRSRWVDYRGGSANESLAALVARIALSLQYRAEHVNAAAPSIANARALAWYSLSRLRHPEWFPTDHSPLEAPRVAAASNSRRPRAMEGEIELRPRSTKRFEIASTTPEYEVAAKPLEQSLRDLSQRSQASGDAGSSHELYVTSGAARTLLEHIEWGRDTPRNCVEQGGLLLGHAFADSERGKVYGVVEVAIPAARAKGSGAYLLMDHDTWKDMIDRVDELSASAGTALHVIGWYHTHPNDLSVFLSGTDRATQARMFAKTWQFAVVLNPQRREWRVFHGQASSECMGFMPTTQ